MGVRAPAPNARLASLDVLRFIAAAAVMVYHYTYHYASAEHATLSPLEALTRHGYLGVEVFFIISGFVIIWSAQDRTPTGFARARVLRLYPEFWVAVIVSAVAYNLAPATAARSLSVRDVVFNLTMVPSLFGAERVDDVYWTLLVELKFYFFVWLLIVLRQLKRIESWLVGWVVVSVLGLFVDLPGPVRSLTMFPYGPLFAAGGIFYFVFDAGWTARRIATILVAAPTAAFFAVEGMSGFIDGAHITPVAGATTAVVIIIAFGFFATIKGHTISPRWVGVAALAGTLTYPLYLLHNVAKAHLLSSPLLGPEWLMVIAAILVSLVLSYVVMRVGTGPVQTRLRQVVDSTIAALGLKTRH